MLTQFALASAETAVNQVLNLDSTARARLLPLAGKVIAIACTAPRHHGVSDTAGHRYTVGQSMVRTCRLHSQRTRSAVT